RAARPPVLNGKHESQCTPRGADALPPPGLIARPALAVPSAKVAMSDLDPNALAQALLMTQQSLAALQGMQEQTAALHKQFLESQEAAQRTLQALVEQQQSLLLSGLGAGAPLPAINLPPPTSVAPPPPTPVPPRVADTPRPTATERAAPK